MTLGEPVPIKLLVTPEKTAQVTVGAPAGKADIFSDFINTIGELYTVKPKLPVTPLQSLFSAWLAFKTVKAQSAACQQQLITCLGQSPTSKDHKAKLAAVQTHFIPTLAKPYPSEGLTSSSRGILFAQLIQAGKWTGKFIMVVIWNFCEYANVLGWVDDKVHKMVGHKKSVWYSAGSW
ncbi:hypothetical protein PAXINDRAFT_152831 [Paxillus involutus ATCC 200175]|nr:hypothetical protein PAXINDRAFT_152831 [Paxillus involutus ATCC 200175]